VIGGIFVNDLGIIFELLAALTITQIGFIWPGVFFLIADKRYGTGDLRNRYWSRFNAKIQIALGILVFILIVISNILD
jgi:hypothetical protein